LGHSSKKVIRYGTGEFKRRLVGCTGTMGTLLRWCNMFDGDNMETLGRVGPGK
jgi:hypothetical protein